MPNTYSKSVQQQILDLYVYGTPVEEISKIIGCSKSYVQRLRKRHGLSDRESKEVNERSAHKRRKLSEKDILQCKLKYERGVSTELLAQEYNVSASCVVANLKEAGAQINPYETRMSKSFVDISQCIELYESGVGTDTIAAKMNTTQDIILRRLRRNGIVLRSKNEKMSLSDDEIYYLSFMYNSGMSMKQIAEEVGYSEWCVTRNLRESGVKTRLPNHPFRVEKARALMVNRIKINGTIRAGKNESKLLALLGEQYDNVIPQFQLHPNGHHFDAMAGGILWELDEKRHRWARQKTKDIRYDKEAKLAGYEVRHITENDLFVTGLSKWHNYQD